MQPCWWTLFLFLHVITSSSVESLRIRSGILNKNGSQVVTVPQSASLQSDSNPTDLLLQYYGSTKGGNVKVFVAGPTRTEKRDPSRARNTGFESESIEEVSQEGEDPTTTARVSHLIIPNSLRRKFASNTRNSGGRANLPPSTTEIIVEIRPTNKTKSRSTRRKVKRPSQLKETTTSKLADTTTSVQDDSLDNSPAKSNSSGDNNLAFEIESNSGKYALIDTYFNETGVEKPGIVSYEPSVDFPKDSIASLGNLNPEDIWLSEGNLLVLKGGVFDATKKEKWPPIDAFTRGKNISLKIPLDTNNPPPFPIFVNETGPPVFLGDPPPFFPYPPPEVFGNGSFDPSYFPPPGMVPLLPNGSLPQLPFGPPPNNFGPIPGGPLGPPGGLYGPPFDNKTSAFPKFPPTGPGGKFPPGPPPGGFPPFLPPGKDNGYFPPNFPPPPPNFNQSGGPPPFPLLPPLVLNPNDNETDDPSIFLPPPYDFDYIEDNSTIVPPGPFAPGLVVPPPKDFYTVFNRSFVETTARVVPTTPRPTEPHFAYPPLITKQRVNAKKPNFPVNTDPRSEKSYEVTNASPEVISNAAKTGKIRHKILNSTLSRVNILRKPVLADSLEVIYPTNPAPTLPPPVKINRVYSTQRPTPETEAINTILTDFPITLTNFTPKDDIPSTISTTQKPYVNSFVYTQGRLKTSKEIADDRENENKQYVATPRPAFNSQGYPTRVVEDEPPLDISYVVTPHSQSGPQRPVKPVTSYHTEITNQNNDPGYVLYPAKTRKTQGRTRVPISVTAIPRRQKPEAYPEISYNYGPPVANVRNRSGEQIGNNYGLQLNRHTPINNYYNVAPLNPTYGPITQIQAIRPRDQPRYNNQDQYGDLGLSRYGNQNIQLQLYPAQGNQGFQPSLPLPRRQQHQQINNYGSNLFNQQPGDQQYSNVNQFLRNVETSTYRPSPKKESGSQPLKPQRGERTWQPVSVPVNFAPQGYYSPITRFHQSAVPLQNTDVNNVNRQPYYSSAVVGGINNLQNIYGNYPPYVSVLKLQDDGAASNPNPKSGLGTFTPSQLYPQYKKHHYTSQHNPNLATNYFQEAGTISQKPFAQPLRDDLSINYREPVPGYNTDSESVITPTKIKAGPDSSSYGGSPTSGPATFYSFQRGGPGGFSYKIQL